jgi:catechol 2,3-dioxygenase-like lactoylglutathione lyase family enzyme
MEAEAHACNARRERMTAPRIRALVPMAHVASVPRAAAFYRKLGFEEQGSFTPQGEEEPSWVSLVSERAEIMLTRADEPVVAAQQAVLFYLYCDDVSAFHRLAEEQGLSPGPIAAPFYNPGGEFRLQDPDGYVVMVTHM